MSDPGSQDSPSRIPGGETDGIYFLATPNAIDLS